MKRKANGYRWTEATAIRMIKVSDPVNHGVNESGKTITIDPEKATLGVWSAIDFLVKEQGYRLV